MKHILSVMYVKERLDKRIDIKFLKMGKRL